MPEHQSRGLTAPVVVALCGLLLAGAAPIAIAVSSVAAGSSWGTRGDIPVPGDYDGKGPPHRAVFRPSNSTWYVRNGTSASFGISGDIPVPGDYDGNGTTDIAVFRPSNSTWHVRKGTRAR